MRKLKHNISKIIVSKNVNQNLRDAYEEANRSLVAMQTDNSIHKEQQVIWSKFMNLELYKYLDFRSK